MTVVVAMARISSSWLLCATHVIIVIACVTHIIIQVALQPERSLQSPKQIAVLSQLLSATLAIFAIACATLRIIAIAFRELWYHQGCSWQLLRSLQSLA